MLERNEQSFNFKKIYNHLIVLLFVLPRVVSLISPIVLSHSHRKCVMSLTEFEKLSSFFKLPVFFLMVNKQILNDHITTSI